MYITPIISCYIIEHNTYLIERLFRVHGRLGSSLTCRSITAVCENAERAGNDISQPFPFTSATVFSTGQRDPRSTVFGLPVKAYRS